MAYLLRVIGHDKQLGLIAMEYSQSAKEEGTFKRDDRVTLYQFLIKQPYAYGKQQLTIINKMIALLPILKNKPNHLIDLLESTKYKNNEEEEEEKEEKEEKKIQLDDLERNFFKYRIVAHIIYYMLKAFYVGYIHTDLHVGNIYVLDIKTKFNACINPFSLNDVGIKQLNTNYQIMLQNNIFGITPTGDNMKCDSIYNFCNMSCIEIIDWGRTRDISNNNIEFKTFDEFVNIINELKKQYQKFDYLFNLVELGGKKDLNVNELNYKQFYVLWLIYNELKFKKIIEEKNNNNKSNNNKSNNNKFKCIEINTNATSINDIKFTEYLNKFKDNYHEDPFYETYTEP